MTTGAVLVVEDEQKVADALQRRLEGEGYEVAVERTGEDAFFRISTETFDVVLLDLTLPGRDGLEILRGPAAAGADTRVLILTARDTLEERVQGPRQRRRRLSGQAVRVRRAAGADSRPGAPRAAVESPRLAAGDLEMDLWTRKVTRAGAPSN